MPSLSCSTRVGQKNALLVLIFRFSLGIGCRNLFITAREPQSLSSNANWSLTSGLNAPNGHLRPIISQSQNSGRFGQPKGTNEDLDNLSSYYRTLLRLFSSGRVNYYCVSKRREISSEYGWAQGESEENNLGTMPRAR
jgi:hypothetical protein